MQITTFGHRRVVTMLTSIYTKTVYTYGYSSSETGQRTGYTHFSGPCRQLDQLVISRD